MTAFLAQSRTANPHREGEGVWPWAFCVGAHAERRHSARQRGWGTGRRGWVLNGKYQKKRLAWAAAIRSPRATKLEMSGFIAAGPRAGKAGPPTQSHRRTAEHEPHTHRNTPRIVSDRPAAPCLTFWQSRLLIPAPSGCATPGPVMSGHVAASKVSW